MSGTSLIGNRQARQFSSRGGSQDLYLLHFGVNARKKQTGESSWYSIVSWILDVWVRCGLKVPASQQL
jgi:hypothetical protein